MKNEKLNIDDLPHRELLDKKRIGIVNAITFFMGFSQAVILYVFSSYFKLVTGQENVGPYYLAAYIVVFLLLLNLHKFVKRFGKCNAFYFSLLFKLIIISFLMIMPPTNGVIIFLMLYLVFGNLEWASLDVILESFSADKMSGRIRGLHLTLLNAGFLFGPLISTKILENFGFSSVFLTIFILNSIVFLLSLSLRNMNHRFESDVSAMEVLRKVWKRKNVLRIYYISFVLEFFYALMVIYTPIYLLNLGLGWDKIGIIFTAMLVPFVILQYPMGILADKKWGEKEAIIVSIVIMAVSTAVVYFVGSTNLAVWSAVLFATRIGAATLEALRDSYFYKRIDGQDVDLINFFRTAMPAGFVFSSAISAVALIFFPLKIVFLIVAVVVFSALIPAFMLQDNKSEREILAEGAM
jgi:MFS family permease